MSGTNNLIRDQIGVLKCIEMIILSSHKKKKNDYFILKLKSNTSCERPKSSYIGLCHEL